MKIFLQILLSFIVFGLNMANEGSFDHRIMLYSIGTISLHLVPRGMAEPAVAQIYRHRSTMVKVTNETETKDRKVNLMKSYLECFTETRLNPQLLVRFIARYWDNNPDIKEWTLCILCKLELMTPQGVYRYDTALTKIPKHDKRSFDVVIDRCLSNTPQSPREIAWQYVKCIDSDKNEKVKRLGVFFN